MKTKEPATTTRTIWMRPSQLVAIQKIAKGLGVSQASLLREAVDYVIVKYGGRSK